MNTVLQKGTLINACGRWRLDEQVDGGQIAHQNWLLDNVDTGADAFGKFLQHGHGRVRHFVEVSKYNHYGRHREFHPLCYAEIVSHQATFPSSLPRLFDRADAVHVDGARFRFLLMEAKKGIVFSQFLKANACQSEIARRGCVALGIAVAELHRCRIAHGDAHTDNVLIEHANGEYRVSLVDLCMLHFPEFQACQQFKCFQQVAGGSARRRFEEDLRNTLRVGQGFLTSLKSLEDATGLNKILTRAFLEGYHRS